MRMIFYPEFTLPPINLLVMPALTVNYKEHIVRGKRTYSTSVKENTIYQRRKEAG